MDQRLQIVLALMEDKLHENLSLDELARSANVSVSYFHHLFKALTGRTPGHYLRTLRMQRARELLGTTVLSVKQVMNKTGFSDRSHFDREFKRVYGLTPAQHQRSQLFNNYLSRIGKQNRP
jgi:transcriptional regulator GlxA family with amidase domain